MAQDIETEMRNLTKAMGVQSKAIDAFIKIMGKQVTAAKKSAGVESKLSGDSMTALLENLDDLADEMSTFDRAVENSAKVWGKFTTHVSGAAQAMGSFIDDIAASGDGLGMFKSFIKPATDMIEGLANAAGSLMEGMGDLLSKLGPVGTMFGSVAAKGGEAVKAMGKVAAGLVGFAANLLLSNVEQLWDMFSSVTSAGVLFANGLTEMNQQREMMLLTTKEYSELMKNAGSDLLVFGGSLAKGAKELAKVTRANASHRTELAALGITYQEQAEQTADFMAMMSRTAQLRTLSDQQIADQSYEYMKSLKVISALTGKTADEMKAERDEAAGNLAFQAKLATLSAKQAQEVTAAMRGVPKEMQAAFKESVVFGKVMTDVGAITTGAAGHIEKFASAVMRGEQSAIEGLDSFKNGLRDAGPELMRRTLELQATGMAAMVGAGSPTIEAINSFGSAFIGELAAARKYVAGDAQAAAKAGITGQKGGTGDLINTMQVQRDIQNDLMKMTVNNMPKIASGMKIIADTTKWALEKAMEHGFDPAALALELFNAAVPDDIKADLVNIYTTGADALETVGEYKDDSGISQWADNFLKVTGFRDKEVNASDEEETVGFTGFVPLEFFRAQKAMAEGILKMTGLMEEDKKLTQAQTAAQQAQARATEKLANNDS